MSLKLVDTNWSLMSVIACCAYMSFILQVNSYSVELIIRVILLVYFQLLSRVFCSFGGSKYCYRI